MRNSSGPRVSFTLSVLFAITACSSAALACETVDGVMCGIPSPAYDVADNPDMAVSAKIARPLNAAWQLASDKKYAEALAQVQPLTGLKKTLYETYMVEDLIAVLNYNLGNATAAADAFAASIATGVVPEKQVSSHLAAMTQIYYSTGDYARTIDSGKKYIAHAGPDTDIYVLLGEAYYHGKDFKPAAEAFHTALKTAASQKAPVKEEWLRLAMSGDYQINDTHGVIATLEQLMEKYPKPDYWRDLLQMVEFTYHDAGAGLLEVYRLRFATGLLADSDDYLRMAAFALNKGMPGEAKAVLEKAASVATDAGSKAEQARLLAIANTRLAGAQYALPRAAAALATAGDADVQAGERARTYGRYGEAIAAIQSGLQKGVSNADEAHLRLGMAYLGAGEQDQAQKAFAAITSGTLPSQVAKLWTLASTNGYAAARQMADAAE